MLTKDSKMPYGAHKGLKMKDVPAKYLVWLYDNNKCNADVKAYIAANLSSLRAAASINQSIKTFNTPTPQQYGGMQFAGIENNDECDRPISDCDICLEQDTCKLYVRRQKYKQNKPKGRYV